MIETIIYIFLGWFIMRTVLGVIAAAQEDANQGDEKEQIEDHLRKKKSLVVVKVKMEQINGWWYGFYPTKEGGELFVAQGTTFEEAVENCKQRLQSEVLDKKTKLIFDKS